MAADELRGAIMPTSRRTRIAWRLAALGIGGLVVLGPRAAAAEELVTPQDGTSYQLAARPRSTVRVPLDLRAGVDARSLRLTVLRVQRNSVQDVSASAFKPTYRSNPPRINVAVDLARAPGAGTYELSLRITSGRRVQHLELQLIRPFATLEGPTTFIVERTLIFPWWTKERTPPLRVVERSGALVAGASVRQVDAAAAGFVFGPRPFTPSGAPAGALASNVIQPNGSVDIAYSLNGTFPLGTSTRTIEISAPQLQSPTKITLQVRSRRHPAWIAVAVGLGLIAGWLLRTALQRWGELGRARLQALDLLDHLGQEGRDHQDAEFRTTVSGLMARVEALRKGPDWRDGTQIATTVKEVGQELKSALTSLGERREAASTQLAAAIELVETRWSLPESVQAALITAREDLEKASKALRADDPGTAQTVCRTVTEDLDAEVQRMVTEWRDEQLGQLRVLAELEPPPASPALGLVQAAAQAAATVRKLPVDDPKATTGDVLPALHAARLQLRDLPTQTSALVAEALRVLDILAGAQIADRGAVQALEKATEGLRPQRDEFHGPPEATLTALADRVPILLDALQAAIERQTGGRDPSVRDLIRAGRYAEAASKLPPAEAAAAEEEDGAAAVTKRDERLAFLAAERAAFIPFVPDVVSPVASRPSTLALRGSAPPTEVQAERARAFSVILWSSWVQTALVFALLLIAGYVLFAGEFVGTLQDFVRVFLWAFAIDVTVGKLLEVTQGLAAPAAPTRAR
jgi:hypothetical protein